MPSAAQIKKKECTILKFVDDAKLWGAVTALENRNTVQRDPDMLQK